MSDLYSELLVKKNPTSKDGLIKGGMIAGAVLLFVAGITIHPVILLGAVAMCVGIYFEFPRLNLEYEYLYVNGELDIDKIMSKMKRKKLKSFNMREMELLAPAKSHRMDYYNDNPNLNVQDYSSGDSSHKIYAMIIKDGQQLSKVLLEFDDEMMSHIRRTFPSKAYVD